MKRPLAIAMLTILAVTSIKAQTQISRSQDAQTQEPKKADLHKDFPEVQMIRPTDPPWRYNFDKQQWERDSAPDARTYEVENLRAITLSAANLALLPADPAAEHRHKKLVHHKRIHHHRHR